MRARQAFAALVVAAVAAWPTSPAHTAPVPDTRAVDATVGFPTVAAVARVFHAYRDGRRELLRSRQVSVVGEDCLGLQVAGFQPRWGRTALYTRRDRESPFFSGGTAVAIAVHDYRTARRAEAAIREQETSITQCEGRHVEGPADHPFGAVWTPWETPGDLGEDAFTYRLTRIDPNTGRDWFVGTLARRGPYVVTVHLQRDRNAPAAWPAFALTRTALRVVR